MRSALARRGWRGGSEAIRAATAIAALRTLIGAGLIAAPGPMLRSWGYPREESQSATVRALLRTAGGRDLVLGLATLAARGDDRALRRMAAVSAAFDAADTLLSAALLAASPGARKPASEWVSVGVPFTALGSWVARGLR
jgi:Domain of unknown function (DUF4267)